MHRQIPRIPEKKRGVWQLFCNQRSLYCIVFCCYVSSFICTETSNDGHKPSRCVSFDGQIMHQDTFWGKLTCQNHVWYIYIICRFVMICVFSTTGSADFVQQQHVMFLGSGSHPPRHLRLPEWATRRLSCPVVSRPPRVGGGLKTCGMMMCWNDDVNGGTIYI